MAKDVEAQLAILTRFTEVYCRKQHGCEEICLNCREMLEYARRRLEKCPYDPKPACKHCQTHCYREPYRGKIREIMQFSGKYFVKRGRLDWLWKYFLLNRRSRPAKSVKS